MKKWILLILTMVGFMAISKAQEGYQVSGRIAGVPDGTLLLVSAESRAMRLCWGQPRLRTGRLSLAGN